MRVAASDLVPYRLPLAEPVVWNGERRSERDGVLLRLESAEGRVGWGDAAPLPGFSAETVAESQAALAEAARALIGRDLDAALCVRDGPVWAALDGFGLPASARFALDLALVDLARQSLGRSLPLALHPDPDVTLPLNGLVLGGDVVGDAVGAASELASAGYRAVKLKVGRGPVEADVETVRAVRAALPDGVALRIDANRAWSWAEAVAFADGVRGVGLDYVEEPLREPARMPELWHDTGLPLALDETLQGPGGEAHVRGWAEAAVLKPSLVGGVARTLRLAAAARAVGVRPVLSAAFESGVGLRGVAALAAVTGAEPAGLDTYRRLAADVLPPLPFGRPSVDVPGLFAAPLDVRVP